MEALELIQLMKFADEAIGRYITFYMTGVGALAVLVMTQNYKTNFKKIGKILLSLALAGLAFGDWRTLVYYHEIYNTTILELQALEVAAHSPLGEVLHEKAMWHVHGGHVLGAIVGLSLVWWIEISTTIRAWLLARTKRLQAKKRALTQKLRES